MIIRYENPLQSLLDVQRAFESAFESPFFGRSFSSSGSFPGINFFENENNYLITVELPGLEQKNIDLKYERDTLTISGKKEFVKKENTAIHRRERDFGEFSRSITIPSNVNPEKIQAKAENGVLWITLTKAEEAKAKQISIS